METFLAAGSDSGAPVREAKEYHWPLCQRVSSTTRVDVHYLSWIRLLQTGLLLFALPPSSMLKQAHTQGTLPSYEQRSTDHSKKNEKHWEVVPSSWTHDRSLRCRHAQSRQSMAILPLAILSWETSAPCAGTAGIFKFWTLNHDFRTFWGWSLRFDDFILMITVSQKSWASGSRTFFAVQTTWPKKICCFSTGEIHGSPNLTGWTTSNSR